MFKELIEAIQDGVKPIIVGIDGHEYVTRQILIPPAEPALDAIVVHTLTGLVDYLTHRTDELPGDPPFIHVESPAKVQLISKPKGRHQERDQFCTAQAITSNKFQFGQWQDVESFIIGLQSHFVKDEQTALVLGLVGNLKEEAIRTSEDDGVTQVATVKKGVTRAATTPVPNPVTLRPFRTFAEIEQPASLYVLRLKSGADMPSVALFEVTDNLWQLKAIEYIKHYLSDKVGDLKIIT